MPTLKPRSTNAQPAAVPDKPSAIRQGLVPRTIFFPEGFLRAVEREPGGLITVLTLALSAYAGKGGAQ